MKNINYMINLLNDCLEYEDEKFEEIDIDDGGASLEAMINYNIACPYSTGDKRAHCYSNDIVSREKCVNCKFEWLYSEVDE